MSWHRRACVASLIGAGCVALAGCGDNSTSAGNSPVQVRETSYAMLEPETTTTTLAPAATTVPPEGAIDPNEQTYVIQSGDSVSRIASIHGITMDALVQYNQWPDGINHTLIPGQEVRIPPNAKVPGTGTSGGAAGTPSGGSAVPPQTEPAGEPCTYTIQAGDNPSRVASKYGISFNILQAANPEHNFLEWFKIGETIRIPAGADGCDN